MLADGVISYRIQVRRRGQVTIPYKLRERLAIEEGDTLTAVSLGDALILAPRALRVPATADRLADMMEAEGLSLADVLEELPRIRESLYRERYRIASEE